MTSQKIQVEKRTQIRSKGIGGLCGVQLAVVWGKWAENIDWDGPWRNAFCCAKDEVAGSASSLQGQEQALTYLKRD